MALSRRTGQRFQGSIWPGFVDAMTGLLLVLMFVLTIFMVVQFVLRETITGQESKLDELASEVSALASALGLQERENTRLEARMGALTTTLNSAQDNLAATQVELNQRETLIASLTAQRDEGVAVLKAAETKISRFEAQVAALLAGQDRARVAIAALEADKSDLEAAQKTLISEREALDLALAQSRSEIDAQTEAARLAAAKREALEALVADLRQEGEVTASALASSQEALSEEEAARLVEAAASEALRERLENADAELTSMTLQLEAERKKAEDTLTLLAAADTVKATLEAELAEVLARLDGAKAQVQERDEVAEQMIRVLEQLRVDQDTAVTRIAELDAELAEARSGSEQTVSRLSERLAAAETARAALETELAALRDASATVEGERASVEERLLDALAKLERAEAAATESEVLQSRLAAALAAREEAETALSSQQTAAEVRALMLAEARDALAGEQDVSAEAQRQTALLNQQVAALRKQLGGLQAILDDYEARDEAAKVQMQSLGQDLNTALARAAAEERKRRQLEEVERKRLEAEAAQLAAEAESLAGQAKNLERYRSEFFGRMRELLGNQEGVRIQGDRFVFASEVLFSTGSADLSPEGRQEIAKVAGILSSVAADIPSEINWVIRVDGHTDNIPLGFHPRYADNWELSQGRALSVVKYMVGDLGIPADRLSANGFGEFQPVNPENSSEARAQNRRIELKFTEK